MALACTPSLAQVLLCRAGTASGFLRRSAASKCQVCLSSEACAVVCFPRDVRADLSGPSLALIRARAPKPGTDRQRGPSRLPHVNLGTPPEPGDRPVACADLFTRRARWWPVSTHQHNATKRGPRRMARVSRRPCVKRPHALTPTRCPGSSSAVSVPATYFSLMRRDAHGRGPRSPAGDSARLHRRGVGSRRETTPSHTRARPREHGTRRRRSQCADEHLRRALYRVRPLDRILRRRLCVSAPRAPRGSGQVSPPDPLRSAEGFSFANAPELAEVRSSADTALLLDLATRARCVGHPAGFERCESLRRVACSPMPSAHLRNCVAVRCWSRPASPYLPRSRSDCVLCTASRIAASASATWGGECGRTFSCQAFSIGG